VVKPTIRARTQQRALPTRLSEDERGNIHPLLGVVDPAAVIHEDAAPRWGAAKPSSAARIVDNAFRVLGLTPRATWADVAHAAETLLLALAAGDPTVATYGTPLGPQARTAGAVRVARARLRDPDERIQQEIWWEAPARAAARRESRASVLAPVAARRWPHAPAAWGWRSR
jgi:hypothetical protein